MATIWTDKRGCRCIQFFTPDGKRRTLRLGKISEARAERVKSFIEDLLEAKRFGQLPTAATLAWLKGLDERFRDRLADFGLVERENRTTLAEFLQEWLERRTKMNYKPASLVCWQQVIAELSQLCGAVPLDQLTAEHAERYRDAMLARELRDTTIAKRLCHAKAMLEDAVRRKKIAENPWRDVSHRAGDPAERRELVPREVVLRLLNYCPNVYWQLLLVLSRFAGLRVPSEALSLEWQHVRWAEGKLIVPSPKTEGQGKPSRKVPLFSIVREYLAKARQQSPPDTIYVFPEDWRKRACGPAGWVNCNFRQGLLRILRRAGVEPWPRLWHSLRASCESDLATHFTLSTVVKWLGNTPAVALRHYVDPTEEVYAKALHWDWGNSTPDTDTPDVFQLDG
jgi:integrase